VYWGASCIFNSKRIIKVMKSKRMRCVGHGIHMREMRNAYKLLVRKTWRVDNNWRQGFRWRITNIDLIGGYISSPWATINVNSPLSQPCHLYSLSTKHCHLTVIVIYYLTNGGGRVAESVGYGLNDQCSIPGIGRDLLFAST